MSFWDDVKSSAVREFDVGQDENRQAMFKAREKKGLSTEGPRARQMAGAYRTPQAFKAAMGINRDREYEKAREDVGIGFDVSSPGKRVGTAVGAIGSDLIQDSGRRWWWLVNAAQASGDMIAEEVIARARPDLYDLEDIDDLNDPVISKATGKQVYETVDGISKPVYRKKKRRKHGPGRIQALAAPAGFAINTGLGLMTPFGGADGYKAVFQSEDDPTKTSNVIGEIAAKYILGRTGELLPFNEFTKVRPDVSRDEYERYKAFKWDKNTDLNLLDDGKVGAPLGAAKWTNEGIHGPELQFLGKSLPLTTGIVPFATATAGAAMGARYGGRTPIKMGLAGGIGGLLGGEGLGALIENERRNRNMRENTPKSVPLDPEGPVNNY